MRLPQLKRGNLKFARCCSPQTPALIERTESGNIRSMKSAALPFADFALNADQTLLPCDSRVLVAVSSGADSMALLCWLTQGKRDIVVGHVNHALHELRPGECRADEEFVREKCDELNVAFCCVTVDLPRQNGHVNESVARAARYDALANMARANGCALVATAHTATDGLETALLNLMRGGGPQGWLGAPPSRVLQGEIALVRPLYKETRARVRQWLRARGWSWREDESNRDPIFARNRVRAEVLPLFSEISGRDEDELARGHARGAQISRDESNFIEELAQRELLKLILAREANLLILSAPLFVALDVALQRRVLRAAARQIAPDLRDLSADKIEMARLSVIENRARAVWSWPRGVRVEWTGAARGNRIRLWRVGSEANCDSFPPFSRDFK